MWSPKQLREELRFAAEFNVLLDVMQQVSVAQLRRLEEHGRGGIRLPELLSREVLPYLPAAAIRHPLLTGGDRGRLLIVMTSDQGFVGPLHANVMRRAATLAAGATQWLLIGQRGTRWTGASGAGRLVLPMPAEEHLAFEMGRVAQSALARFSRDRLRDVWLIAPRFLTASHQDVLVQQLLPLPVPQRLLEPSPLLEPSLHGALEALAGAWVESWCIDAARSARQAVCAARALHVEASRQQLAKQTRLLRYALFKAQHERVDIAVRETYVVQRHLTRRRSARPAGASA